MVYPLATMYSVGQGSACLKPEFVLPYSFAHTSAVSMWKSATQKAQLQLFMAVRSNLIVEVYLVLRFFSVGKSGYKFQFSNIPLLVLSKEWMGMGEWDYYS